MKSAWMIPALAVGAFFFEGCFQPQDSVGPQKQTSNKNDLSYGLFSGITWTKMPGTAKEIAAGAGPLIWSIGAGSGDQPVRYLDTRVPNAQWVTPHSGTGIRVEADDLGMPWVVNSVGDAWKGDANGNNWVKYNKDIKGAQIFIRDIGAGAGQVWAIGGTTADTYGYMVYQLWINSNGTFWMPSAARGVGISVDKFGNVWTFNLSGQVFEYTNGAWLDRGTPGATSIGAGPDGQVWITGPVMDPNGGRTYKWISGTTWDAADIGIANEIDRGIGFTLVTNVSNDIWKGTP